MRAAEALAPGVVWRLRGRTLQAMALLCLAQLAVKLVPFRYWRATLGRLDPSDEVPAAGPAGPARRLAAHVERGAARLPFTIKCLPRAMALCWLLRLAAIPYTLKIAARPATARPAELARGEHGLHAWVDADNTTVIGALPGPWLVVLALRSYRMQSI